MCMRNSKDIMCKCAYVDNLEKFINLKFGKVVFKVKKKF